MLYTVSVSFEPVADFPAMIGRTDYHNVSGTRCATDFVELPSILMEHFVSSAEVLSLFATHEVTGEPLPLPLLSATLAQQRSLSALETHGQILMAMLDQSYHSLSPTSIASFDSTATHQDLQRRIGVIPPVDGTAWQTQFGHLYGYGATYYSYLFDRAIAGKVWRTLFTDPAKGGSLSREGGEVLKQKVLKWGGGRDPWVMVGDLVGGREGELVRQGDEESMRVVGKWKI
jgi:intermediate peptidase